MQMSHAASHVCGSAIKCRPPPLRPRPPLIFFGGGGVVLAFGVE